ncbi:hypothetical protein QYM36_013341 [Artemia franciscana]|nr:hypothetical protein QYM36_013341 [Artemia franciscana]
MQRISLPEEEYSRRNDFCQVLQTVLEKTIEGSRLYIFGSTLSGLCLNESDLDLYLDVPDDIFIRYADQKKEGLPKKKKKFRLLPGGIYPDHVMIAKRVRKALERHRNFHDIEAIPFARVPIVKFVHGPTGIKGDIQSSVCCGVFNSLLLRTLSELDPRVKQMLILIRYWFKLLGMSGGTDRKRFFSNYAVCLLVILFLAAEGVIPAVQDLVKPNNHVSLEDDWHFDFDTNPTFIAENRTSIRFLLRNFFMFYGKEVDYSTYVLSVLDGMSLPKENFKNLDLPSSQSLYVDRVKNNACDAINLKCQIALQDPFELNNNLTRLFSKPSLERFQQCCQVAAEVLETSSEKDCLKKLFDVSAYPSLLNPRKREQPDEDGTEQPIGDEGRGGARGNKKKKRNNRNTCIQFKQLVLP